MIVHFHRRLIGYAPSAVSRALQRLKEDHRVKFTATQQELAQVQAQTVILRQQLADAEERLQAVEERVHSLICESFALLYPGDLVAEPSAGPSAEELDLVAHVQQLTELNTKLDDIQAFYRADLDYISDTYRSIVSGLHRAMDGDVLRKRTMPGKESAG